ncbi:hypothetical protein BV20DRAFT_637926 [Pilatotrama ljubarskyi]|nr:hypothetical protein BV20DRAFT_637926 [Pilatotrama ljubarskyi]
MPLAAAESIPHNCINPLIHCCCVDASQILILIVLRPLIRRARASSYWPPSSTRTAALQNPDVPLATTLHVCSPFLSSSSSAAPRQRPRLFTRCPRTSPDQVPSVLNQIYSPRTYALQGPSAITILLLDSWPLTRLAACRLPFGLLRPISESLASHVRRPPPPRPGMLDEIAASACSRQRHLLDLAPLAVPSVDVASFSTISLVEFMSPMSRVAPNSEFPRQIDLVLSASRRYRPLHVSHISRMAPHRKRRSGATTL